MEQCREVSDRGVVRSAVEYGTERWRPVECGAAQRGRETQREAMGHHGCSVGARGGGA